VLQLPKVSEYTQRQLVEKSRQAAAVTQQLLEEITTYLHPGVTESEMTAKAKAVFKAHGIEQLWHNPYIRFGSHTLLTFLDKPKTDKTLGEDDIAYIDIGPIIDGIEGDAGHTLVFGNNPLFLGLKAESERLFQLGRQFWMDHNPTGVELYEYIHQQAQQDGYEFILNPAGHLIGAFPHIGWKEGLHSYPYTAEPGMWILEIQIKHSHHPYGAFYESLLI
jgi:methionine aminopeptidase